jgi:hypothetical protein
MTINYQAAAVRHGVNAAVANGSSRRVDASPGESRRAGRDIFWLVATRRPGSHGDAGPSRVIATSSSWSGRRPRPNSIMGREVAGRTLDRLASVGTIADGPLLATLSRAHIGLAESSAVMGRLPRRTRQSIDEA